MRIRGLAALIALTAVCLAPAASATAAAAATARTPPASGDAGYAADGARLSVVETWVKLPAPSQYARELGSLSASVQLWTSRQVFDLKVIACTDAACRPGGKPVKRFYHAVLDIYNRANRTLTCSTAVTGRLRCPGDIGSFSRARIAAGRTIMLDLVYTIPYDSVIVDAGSQDYFYFLPGASGASGKPALDFTEARICAELGNTPWAAPDLHSPAKAMLLMSFDRPAPPPYEAEIGNLRNNGGGLVSPWWAHRRIGTDPRPPYAGAGPLWDDGYGISVYLRP